MFTTNGSFIFSSGEGGSWRGGVDLDIGQDLCKSVEDHSEYNVTLEMHKYPVWIIDIQGKYN